MSRTITTVHRYKAAALKVKPDRVEDPTLANDDRKTKPAILAVGSVL
jgi:hypothetical protein